MTEEDQDATFSSISAFGSMKWVAARLGRSYDWFRRDRNREALAERGFPKPHPAVGHYIKADVETWIEAQRTHQESVTVHGSKNTGVNLNAL